ncbi:fasciclin domain-containing protein [Mucilaginibacter boryungensis]|uniref:Fasciclin domain-containing protein n=1 Tax=Mucilaginibacter boryungensis TaxID=768480 RepID=A0ABR9XH32_9SPHI|nr:fasciclin domain-containing protein [Mucilaginibacter boryungensis]MBE9666370.1 fasciclin domain-containing protein [Mucilaginibacter boryungensis]
MLCLILVFGGCRKKAFDEYYGRPDNLQPPIYQVLQQRGNFTTLLAVIDKSGYKPTLSAAGYWTFFAPNDAAFQKYFTANNLTLDKIDSVTARKIVTYALVYNAFQTDHLSDYQSGAGWVPGAAFKRRTAYYDSFYTGPGPEGPNTVLISQNRNAATYQFGDNNNKYIPYFTSAFFASAKLTASDYNYFFPGTTFSGFNVVNGTVVNKDILAENGVIHEIDQVVLPLPSLEQKLATNSQYSVFKNLYDQFMIGYSANADITSRYNVLTGKSDKVYVKFYSALLSYAPNNENFLKLDDNDGQQNGYSMFAPTNDALTPYLNTVILEFYKDIKNLPPNIIADLLNAHMWTSIVWPSKFNTTANSLGEPARFNASADVVEKQFCSNGVFYGVSQVQKANVFSTVYARAYLDPAYSIMTRLLNDFLKTQVTSPTLKYTVFMMSDATLNALGYGFNTTTSNYTFTQNGSTTSGATPKAALQRILNLNIVPTPNGELNSLAGDGIAETNGGEYIRWHNNTVSSGRTVELGQTLTVVDSRTYSNGKVYFLNSGLLDAPTKTIAADIAANAGTSTAQGPYYDFYQYLINSTAYSAAAGEINNIQLGGNYTVFIPTQAAMKQAVVDGFLPGTTTIVGGVKTFASFTTNPTTTADKDLVARFIYFHILNGITIAPDGKKGVNGTPFPTLLKDSQGNTLNLITFNQPNNLKIQDNQVRTATVTPPNNNSYFPATSNYLGNRALLHQIDNYLRYNY